MQAGDEVIVPANTYIASILAITDCGLNPVLVEPSPETLQIDDRLIESAITERTRALMIVHLYGRCAYTPHIADIRARHNLKLIEDNAQAHGCTYLPPLSSILLPPSSFLQVLLKQALLVMPLVTVSIRVRTLEPWVMQVL